MKTRDFCARVAREIGASQEEVFRIFVACIKTGKDLMAEGDEWRLPGLGKLYCTELAPRTPDPITGDLRRTLDAFKITPGKRVKCKFTAFKSATQAASEELDEE